MLKSSEYGHFDSLLLYSTVEKNRQIVLDNLNEKYYTNQRVF